MLKERNKNYNAINFVDISSDDYSPEDNQGLDYETVCYNIKRKKSPAYFLWNFAIVIRHIGSNMEYLSTYSGYGKNSCNHV